MVRVSWWWWKVVAVCLIWCGDSHGRKREQGEGIKGQKPETKPLWLGPGCAMPNGNVGWCVPLELSFEVVVVGGLVVRKGHMWAQQPIQHCEPHDLVVNSALKISLMNLLSFRLWEKYWAERSYWKWSADPNQWTKGTHHTRAIQSSDIRINNV
jgi:hypothetical protein